MVSFRSASTGFEPKVLFGALQHGLGVGVGMAALRVLAHVLDTKAGAQRDVFHIGCGLGVFAHSEGAAGHDAADVALAAGP